MTNAHITPYYVFGVFLAYAAFSILLFIPTAVIYWKLFKKAGHEGWRAIVPVDWQYTMGIIAGTPKIGLIAGISWVAYISQALARTFYIDIPQFAVLTITIIWIVSSLVLLSKFIQKFDAGIGRWIVFVFFPLVGMFFVKSVRYKDASGVTTTVGPAPEPTSVPLQQPVQDSDSTPPPSQV